MTRAELIHQMALMTDKELENCIQIYKDGGKQTSEPVILTGEGRFPTFESLQEFVGDNNEDYDLQAFYNDKDALNTWWEDRRANNEAHMTGKYKLPSHITYDNGNWKEEADGWHYYVPSDHMAGGQYYRDYDTYVDYWNRNEPESTLHYGDKTYKVSKHQEGGTIDLNSSNLNEQATSTLNFQEKEITLQGIATELNKPEEPQYKQIKLHKSGGSLIDQLKDQLGDSEIIDLLQNFGIDELMQGGLKNTKSMSISIIIEDDGGHKIPEMRNIEIGDKSYKVEIVSTDEDMEKGLGERESLDKDCGMLFDFGSTQQEVTFNCEEMQFPIDIVFINDEDEVIRVAENCQPGKDLFTESNVRYVLEVNANSKIKQGDELDVDPEEDSPVMKVLSPDGSTQMELQGGERIFSRVKTKQLIKWAKRCNKTKKESDYKHLGTLMFKEIKAQDERKPEYVEVPEN